jgi:23S rRNA (cytidine2498-2'-O)-methyltransferase
VTFKLPDDATLADDFDLRSTFVRAYGFSLGRVKAESPSDAAAQVWRLVGDQEFSALHVWPRDRMSAGFRGYEPGFTDESRAAEAALRADAACLIASSELPTPSSQRVLDVVVVEPNEWLVGYHRTKSGPSRWPGGMREMQLPPDAVSRAWLKMEEALRWSKLPIRKGQEFVEIGCAPGGSCQAVLSRGLRVVGIDPAEVDPRVAEHPYFTHVRKRGADVRRRAFRKTHWLASDMNVAPSYTLDTIEAIVTHPLVHVRGLLLTLKLLDWALADDLPAWLERIGGWGFSRLRSRQLQHNRQEICVAALR